MFIENWSPIKHLSTTPQLANWMSGIVAFGIIWLSLTPLPELPDVPGTDKTHHIVAYAILAIPTAFAYPKRILVMAFTYILLGGMIELIQPFVCRYGEWLDFTANLSGVIFGSFIGLLLNESFKN